VSGLNTQANLSGLGTSANGSIYLTAGGALNVQQNVSANGTGTVDLRTSSGDLTITDTKQISSGNGTVQLIASAGNVAVSANTTAVEIATGGDLLISASAGIGSLTNRLDTNVTGAAMSAGAGGITVREVDALDVKTVSGLNTQANLSGLGTSANGSIYLTAGGALNVQQNVSANGTGNVALQANGSSSDIAIAAGKTISSTGAGTVQLVAGRSITAGDNASTTKELTTGAGGSVLLSATQGIGTTGAHIDTTTNTLAARLTGTPTGDIFIRETDALVIGSVTPLDGFNGGTAIAGITTANNRSVTLTAGGAVTQSAGANVTASGLELLGSGSYVLNNTGNTVANISSAGTAGFKYTNSANSNLTVGTVTGTGTSGIAAAGDVALTTQGTGSLTVASPITLTGSGNLDITTSGAFQVNQPINATGHVIVNGVGSTTLNNDIFTSTSLVQFFQPVVLTGNRKIDTTAPGGLAGSILFSKTLGGGGNSLTLIAPTGSGDITFNQAVTNLSGLTVTSGRSFTTNPGASINVNSGATGVSVNVGGAITVQSSITTNNTPIVLNGTDWVLSGGAGSINAGSAPITLSRSTAGTITVGAGAQIDSTDLAALSSTNQTNIGNGAAGNAINVAGSVTFAASTPNVNLLATGGGNNIDLNAVLTSPTTTTLNSAGGNINFNAGGQVNAPGQTVNLTSTTGTINGNSSDTANFLAGGTNRNVIATSLAAVSANGIGATSSPDQALVTQVTNLSARTTSNSSGSHIRIYNDGATVLAGGADPTYAINSGTGGGSFTMVSTGPITQSKALQTNALAAVTVNSPGADITLANTNNHAASYSIYACLALPGGCPSDANVNPVIGNGSNANYADGSISYKDAFGSTLSGIGTISSFSTFVNGPLTIAASNLSANNLILGAGGDITLNLTSPMTKINNAGTGALTLNSGGSIYMLNSSGTIGTASSPFKHDLFLNAAGGINIDNSIYQGLKASGSSSLNFSAGGDVALLGNHIVQTAGDVNVTGRNFSVLGGRTGGTQAPNGQELTSAGTINLLNTGAINIQAGTATGSSTAGDSSGTSASGARVTAGTINIGSKTGTANPTQLKLQGGTNSLGYKSSDPKDPLFDLRQADAKLTSTGDTTIYLRSDPALAPPLDSNGNAITFGGPYSLVVRGGTVNAVADGSDPIREVSALGALQAKNLTLSADGSILLQGGSSTVNSSNVLSETSAVILVEVNKTITTTNKASNTTPGFGSVLIKGGSTFNSSGSAAYRDNARARALLDPSQLMMDVAGALVVESGIGPTGSFASASATISAGKEVRITVRGPTTSYTYLNSDGSTRSLSGSFFLIGGSGSGFFDSENTPLGGEGAPKAFPITIDAPGGFVRSVDQRRSDSIIHTGLTTFNLSLLNYIIFAANDETQRARVRRGFSDSDDVGSPACK
jgi:hypothetical protein